MVFVHNDFYTTSGSAKLYNCWTESVTKFDTSSFYNWEQDNLPVYDLEERTHLLWEKLGHPTSSLPGIVLVVSAGGAASNYVCNTNIYETIADAIAALPEVLNYPVIIEVCNKGALGDLILRNIKFGCDGSLEIVNKNFAKMEPYTGTSGINVFATNNDTYTTTYGKLGWVSGDSLGVIQHFLDTKSEFLNKKVFSSMGDLSSNQLNINGLMLLASLSGYHPPSYGTSVTSLAATLTGFPNAFGLLYYESILESTTDKIHSYDISSFEEVTNTSLIEKKSIPQGEYPSLQVSPYILPMIGLFYGNTLSRAEIINCDGPLYIRNFFVDGSGLTTSNDYGFTVGSCPKVLIENCASIKNNKAGFFFNNSNVTLTRGIAAYRNYSRPRQVTNVSSSYDTDLGAGLLAINSNINFSSTSSFEYSKILQDPTYFYVSGNSKLAYDVNCPINFNRNANGIVLQNSKLYGGVSGSYPTELICDQNFFAGLRMINSEMEWNGKLLLHSNDTGLLADNSIIKTDLHTAIFNQKFGVNLKNSTLKYGKNLNYSDTAPQIVYDRNGVHLHLDNSNYLYESTSSVFSKVGYHKFFNSHSVNNKGTDSTSPNPSINVLNSSKCTLLHPLILRDASSIVNAHNNTISKKGIAIKTENNSTCITKGTNNYATRIFGPNDVLKQLNSVGVFTSNNSCFNIQGPSVMARLAIDVLTEDNSVLNIAPHNTNGILEINEFDLSSPHQHTTVELHSTRACLVANKNSVINIKDLGDFQSHWSNSSAGVSALSYGPDLKTYSDFNGLYTSAGYLQFYPNPTINNVPVNFGPDLVNTQVTNNTLNYQGALPTKYYLFNRATAALQNFSSITLGGMCVRAFENSVVNLRNVNFPCGWWNPSAPIYDAEGSVTLANLCSKLFIWNIGDNSQLHANYCSVSSNFPQAVGYHGPKALWQSNFVAPINVSGNILNEAPSGTPDTSSLSIFDYFGSGPTSGTFSSVFFTSSYQNQGPFRLFFSVDPAAYLLNLVYNANVTGSTGYDLSGWLYQIYSQGYQPPYSASAPIYASAIHKSLFKGNYASGVCSGFYYGSSMLISPNIQRIFLDESASNIFANAKHCSVGKSGLGKIVSIYYPYKNILGGESWLGKDIGLGLDSVNTFDLNRDN